MTQLEFNEEITKLLAELTAKVKALQDQVNELSKRS
jgi:hypothetical protein